MNLTYTKTILRKLSVTKFQILEYFSVETKKSVRVADQIAGRKMKDAATGEEDRCGRRRRRWRHCRRNRSRDNVNFCSVCIFRHFQRVWKYRLKCLPYQLVSLFVVRHILVPKPGKRVPIQTVPVKLRPLCQSTRTWCKVSLEIRNYYPMWNLRLA